MNKKRDRSKGSRRRLLCSAYNPWLKQNKIKAVVKCQEWLIVDMNPRNEPKDYSIIFRQELDDFWYVGVGKKINCRKETQVSQDGNSFAKFKGFEKKTERLQQKF